MGSLIRFLRLEAAVTRFNGIDQEKLAWIESGSMYIRQQDFMIIKEQLKQAYTQDGRLVPKDVEDLMENGLRRQQEIIKTFQDSRRKEPKINGLKQRQNRTTAPQYKIPELSANQRLRNDLVALHKIKLSATEAQQLWEQNRRDELYEGLLYVIGEEIENMEEFYSQVIYKESFSAGGVVLQKVLESYNPSKHRDSLIGYLRQQLRVRIPVILQEEDPRIGYKPISLNSPVYEEDGNGEGEMMQDQTALPPAREKVESFDDLRGRLDFVEQKVYQESEKLNGEIIHRPQKQEMARSFGNDLQSRQVFDVLSSQGGDFGIYFSGQWGALAFTRQQDPLRAVIVVNKSHDQLKGVVTDLVRRLNGEIINNNGTTEFKCDYQGRPVFIDVVSSASPNEQERDSLMEIFANAVIVRESRQGMTEQIARQTFNRLGEEATDRIFGHYEEFLERQRKILKDIEGAIMKTATNQAMNVTEKFERGGIDLTPANMNLQTQNPSGEIKFHIDPAQLQQLQNAPGFVPVIINVQPLKSLQEFLGLSQEPLDKPHRVQEQLAVDRSPVMDYTPY